jgi:DNA ligase-1
MNTSAINLYKVSKDDGMQIWSISVVDWVIHIAYGRLGGAQQIQTETVDKGLAGRTLKEQVVSRVKSRINKQLDRGYKKSIEEAKNNVGLDASGNIKPMLAQPYKRVSSIDWSNAFLQPKYDGHRMLSEKMQGQVRGWSRLGKPITQVKHVFSVLTDMMSDGDIVDGELYLHGTPLQTIASWIKREQLQTNKLMYIIFDIISPMPFWVRLEQMKEMARKARPPVIFAPTLKITKNFNLTENVGILIKEGFEGGILRHGSEGYEIGVRSNNLVKVKRAMDAEFKCVDITPSRDGWAVLTLETKEGKRFGASAPGTVEHKKMTLDNPQNYLGKMVTVEYSQLTKDGIPFHPVATRWREDL